jgi:hypothetical protein
MKNICEYPVTLFDRTVPQEGDDGSSALDQSYYEQQQQQQSAHSAGDSGPGY